MSKRNALTVSEKIVLAAYELEREGRAPFSPEELIVMVREHDPGTFGLRAYSRHHPDASVVFSALVGQADLFHPGWFLHIGPRLRTLSRQGRWVARGLTEERRFRPEEVSLEPEPAARLGTMLNGPEAGDAARTFVEACRFWQLTERCRGSDVDATLAKTLFFLSEVDARLDGHALEMENGERVDDEKLLMLEELHTSLSARFHRHLNLLRRRPMAS